ncbi:MAG: hypothetical protein IKI58_06965 [Oscillospiraceae bacterium]|nr:hypothetical protein [Oscillospiraceae bacterium]
MPEDNSLFIRVLTLSIPVLFLGTACFCLLCAAVGRIYDRFPSRLPDGKTGRLAYAAAGLLFAALGGWLLYHWICGPSIR